MVEVVVNSDENEMTLEQARQLLSNTNVADILSSGNFEQARKILKDNDPNDPVLKEFEERYERHTAALSNSDNTQSENNQSEDSQDDEDLSILIDPDNTQSEDNQSEVSQDDEDLSMYTANHAALVDANNAYTYEDFRNRGDEILSSYIERAELRDEHDRVLDAETKKDYMNLLFESAKLKAEIALTTDKEYSKYQFTWYYRDMVNDFFALDFASAVAAYKVEPVSPENAPLETQVSEIANQAAHARGALHDMFGTDKQLSIKTDTILAACADAAYKAESFVGQLTKKAKKTAQTGFANLAVSIQKSKNKLEEKAMFVSKNRYAIFKNIKGSLHDNAIKIGGNLAASTALGIVAATAGAPAVASAMAVYGAYHAVSAWVYPIIAEKRKITRLAKEQGTKAVNPWKSAWKNVTTKPEGKKVNSYVLQGVINTALGVIGGSVLARSISAATTAEAAVTAVASARSAARVGRSLTPAVAQITDAGVSYLSDPHNKENAARARQTALTALVGAGINVAMLSLADGVSAENLAEQPEMPQLAGGETALPTDQAVIGDTTAVNQSADSIAQTVMDQESADNGASVAAETIVESNGFPKEYSPEMGISQRQYNTLVRTMEGTLTDAEGDNVTLDNAYANLSDETMQKYFPDMTKEQVLYKYNRLYAFMRRAKETSNGTLRELQTERRFWKYNDEMNAMISLLGCGEALDERTGASVKDLFENKYNDILNSGKTQDISVEGKRNYVLTGHTMADGCENDGGEWKATEVSKTAVVEESVAEKEVIEEVEEPVEEVAEEPVEEVEEEVIEEVEEPVEEVEEEVIEEVEEPVEEVEKEPVEESRSQKGSSNVRKGGTSNYEDMKNTRGAWRRTHRYQGR